ncbi:glycosyltransferase family 4 protein [Calycomorphotria hydatis]|uniref:D-inositol 3-phosphate glycosyltransferase n=1 Tax=Calycomorphotria hydatis TaxID=2528027 RepID=A0A517T4G5_9PLAN|nr:glycosyltransferase family 4 protein [Calycomorphotria hydatis]QDT63276.1 D-inositol 3-phosphate glycosyltransferase [Calycomorphotria hydatis]
MPRVALLFEFPTLFGGERSMLAVVDCCLKEESEWEFVAVCPSDGALADAFHERDVEVIACDLREGTKRPPKEVAMGMLCDVLTNCEADLIHANSLSMSRLLGGIADQLQPPCTGHLRDIIKLNRAAISDLNQLDRLVAVSNATRDHHVSQGLDPAKVETIYNGVDPEIFCPREKTYQLHDELGLPHDAILCLTVGQIGLRKGQDVLAKAAAQLFQTKQQPRETSSGPTVEHAPNISNLHFLLVGERYSQKDESIAFDRAIDEVFASAGIADRLHRLGYRNDVAYLMNECDLLIHPAHQEPLGRVLLEAAASGLPIIATDVGGTREILKEGDMHTLIQPGDPTTLAAAVLEFLRNPNSPASLPSDATFAVKTACVNLLSFWRKVVGE